MSLGLPGQVVQSHQLLVVVSYRTSALFSYRNVAAVIL